MATVSTYLNFAGNTEEAFNFYRQVFGGDFIGGIHRMREAPAMPGQPPLPQADQDLVLHVALATLGGHVLMGSDAPASMGFNLAQGNNMYINLQPDTRAETERLFAALAEGGTILMPLQDMFWGDYYGSLRDRFGVHWMCNCSSRT